jgi:L-lactate dehydrogenase (cytochrome)
MPFEQTGNAADRQDYEARRVRFPTVASLRNHARRCSPHFAFEYGDGGAGTGEGIAHNRSALDAIRIVPRCGALSTLPATDVKLFGRSYNSPIGISPMGTPSIVLPGGDVVLAKAAQQLRVPYTLGIVGGATIETIAETAPDVFWFQLYRCAQESLAFDLMQRAQVAGAHVLMLTLDVPVRTVRPREMRVGLGKSTFRPTPRMLWDIATHPGWAMAFLAHGQPRFANLRRYAGENAGLTETIQFAQRELGGLFSWDEVARYRDRWKGPAVAKGILHPADAEKAVSIGFDGILVSNHGGRQIEGLPASVDCLPAIVRAVGQRATILIDSGIQSGIDIVRALALGASAAFAGKAFLWGLGALGAKGPRHVLQLLQDETQAALAQIGACNPAEARSVTVLHPNAIKFERT